MANKFETKLVNSEDIRDTTTRTSGAVVFGKLGFGVAILTIENDLNQDTTIQLQGKPDEGNNWQDIGSSVATGASTQDTVVLGVPWSLLRITYAADSIPTGGQLDVFLNVGRAGFDSEVEVATGASIEVTQDTPNDLNANANLQIADTDVGAANPVPVKAAGDTIVQTPTITLSAYVANDAVGGLLTFAAAARVSGGGGVITDVIIVDDDGEDAELELWLFDQTFTPIADADAWAPSEADLENLIAIVSTADDTWRAAGTPSAINIEVTRRYDLAGTSMFGQLVTRGTPTYTAADDLTVKIKCLQD